MSLKQVKSRSDAESPFRCCFEAPSPTNGRRTRRQALLFFTSEEGFDFGFGFDLRGRVRPPISDQREARGARVMRCTSGGSFGRVCAWRVAYPERLRYRIGLGPGDLVPQA